MGIERKPARVSLETLTCDKCEVEMEFTGVVLTSMPPQYPHKCPSCGDVVKARKIYPCQEVSHVSKPFQVLDEDDGYED